MYIGDYIPCMQPKRKLATQDFLDAHPVFSLEEATEALSPVGGRSTVVERLKHHVERGRIVRVARGTYATVPTGVSPDRFEPDPFLVARAVRSDAIFAYHAAFSLLGVAHSVWNRYAIFTRKRRTDLDLARARLEFLAHPRALEIHGRHLATQQVEYQGYLLRVTSPERTLVEGFRQLDRVGGPEEHLNCAGAFPTLDLSLLSRILEAYDTQVLWAATGWFLARFQTQFYVPEDYLVWLEKHRPGAPRYLQRQQRGGVLLRRWNLIVPEVLGRESPDER